jgi:O-methyltransferase involved in polyketide biosynthesis
MLFELDRPELLMAKDTVLTALQATPGCRRYPVGIDLQDD